MENLDRYILSERQEQKIAIQEYSMGLIDSALTTDANDCSVKFVVKASYGQHILDFFFENFGGSMSGKRWGIYNSADIINVVDNFNGLFQLLSFKKDEIFMLVDYARALLNEPPNSANRAMLLQIYKNTKRNLKLTSRDLNFSINHLVGLFDSGRGSIRLHSQRGQIWPEIRISLKHKAYIDNLERLVGGSTYIGKSAKGGATNVWKMTGSQTAILLRDYFLPLSQFRRQEIINVLDSA